MVQFAPDFPAAVAGACNPGQRRRSDPDLGAGSVSQLGPQILAALEKSKQSVRLDAPQFIQSLSA